MATASFTTPIPATTSPDAVISTLHNHELYIKTTTPTLITYKLVSGTPELGQACEYEVTDKRPVGSATYKLTLTNVNDGINAVVNAKPPTGQLAVKSAWRVVEGNLKEEVDIEGNMLTKKMAKGNVEKSRPEQHKVFIQA